MLVGETASRAGRTSQGTFLFNPWGNALMEPKRGSARSSERGVPDGMLGHAGGGPREHSTAGGRTLGAEAHVTSNVGQNYPYTSESDSERIAAVASLLADRPELADTLKAESTPLDANDRWWVYKCPSKGCKGLLHAAGYAAERHALFTVCDGTCGKTFLK